MKSLEDQVAELQALIVNRDREKKNRELLEMAAIASDIDGKYYTYEDNFGVSWGIRKYDKCESIWNPLISNHDAFSLSVKLKIEVMPKDRGCSVVYFVGYYDSLTESDAADLDRAARVAIVRAAAEIGRYKLHPEMYAQQDDEVLGD